MQKQKYITQAALKFAQSLFMKLHVGLLDVLEKMTKQNKQKRVNLALKFHYQTAD